MQQDQSIFRIFFLKIRLSVQWIFLGIIRGYRYIISPLLPPSCRFTPTCSCYAAEAITSHGPLKGGFLALCRILRCHPFCKGGYDPVPPADDESGSEECDESSKRSGTATSPQCVTQLNSIIL